VAGFLLPQIEDEREKSSADSRDPFRAYLSSTLKLFSGLANTVEVDLF